MLKLLLPLLCASTALSGCRAAGQITIPNTEACAVAGSVSAGGFCAETISGATRDIDVDAFFDLLENGAICQTAGDWNAQKTVLEQACRALGKHCSYEAMAVIRNMQMLLDTVEKGKR